MGKFNEHSKKPHPIIVKLNWAIDASSSLSKAKYLPKHVRIKPDMSPAERHTELLLLKERWSLIQKGIDRKKIKIHYNQIYVQKILHGQVINSVFIQSLQVSSYSLAATEPSSNLENDSSSSSSTTSNSGYCLYRPKHLTWFFV